jgi:hypothetical protein
MAASVKAIRAALRDRLATITFGSPATNLRAYDTVVGQVEPPAAIVRIENINYDSSMSGGSHDPTFAVLVIVSTATERVAQDLLDDFLDPESSTSIKVAVEADPTLAGTVDYATVTNVRSYGLVEYAGVQYLGAELLVVTGIQ